MTIVETFRRVRRISFTAQRLQEGPSDSGMPSLAKLRRMAEPSRLKVGDYMAPAYPSAHFMMEVLPFTISVHHCSVQSRQNVPLHSSPHHRAHPSRTSLSFQHHHALPSRRKARPLSSLSRHVGPSSRKVLSSVQHLGGSLRSKAVLNTEG